MAQAVQLMAEARGFHGLMIMNSAHHLELVYEGGRLDTSRLLRIIFTFR